MTNTRADLNNWNVGFRIFVFLLAATSLGCLLADFYHLCSMQLFTVAVFLPAMAVLIGLTLFDFSRGNGNLGRAVLIGAAGGLVAAVAYDIFRLPFVFARPWGIESVVPALSLFKVFPAFGAMILGQAPGQETYSTGVSLLGWAYHFSNGITIGIMYLALIGDARLRHWGWAVLVAVGLELGMLLTPYPGVFGIPVNARFVAVTMGAHAIFGVCLGLAAKALSFRSPGR